MLVVTGGAGLLGRHVVRRLVRAGREVRVADRHQAGAEMTAGAESVTADLLDPEQARAAVDGATVVVHGAAIPRPGIVGDDELFRVNTLSTWNVLEACVDAGVGTVVVVSSTAVYGTDWSPGIPPVAYLPLDEEHPLTPGDAYGLSKKVSEAIAARYRDHGLLDARMLRVPMLATDDDFERWRAGGGEPVTRLHHYGYLHVEDAAEAVDRSAEGAPPAFALLVAAPDSRAATPLFEGFAALGHVVPGAERLGPTEPGVRGDRTAAWLGWEPARVWRRER